MLIYSSHFLLQNPTLYKQWDCNFILFIWTSLRKRLVKCSLRHYTQCKLFPKDFISIGFQMERNCFINVNIKLTNQLSGNSLDFTIIQSLKLWLLNKHRFLYRKVNIFPVFASSKKGLIQENIFRIECFRAMVFSNCQGKGNK